MTWSTPPASSATSPCPLSMNSATSPTSRYPTALQWKRDNHSPKPGACVTPARPTGQATRWNTSAMIAWAGRIAYRCRHWNPTRWARSASRWWPRPRRAAGAARGKHVTAAAAFSPSSFSPTSSSPRWPVATTRSSWPTSPCPTEKKSKPIASYSRRGASATPATRRGTKLVAWSTPASLWARPAGWPCRQPSPEPRPTSPLP